MKEKLHYQIFFSIFKTRIEYIRNNRYIERDAVEGWFCGIHEIIIFSIFLASYWKIYIRIAINIELTSNNSNHIVYIEKIRFPKLRLVPAQSNGFAKRFGSSGIL